MTTINIQAGGANGVTGAGADVGKQDPASMTTKAIVNELTNGNPDAARKKELVDELEKRTKANGEAAGNPPGVNGAGQQTVPGTDDSIEELLKKLKDGTITRAEFDKLAKALGIDPIELAQMNPSILNKFRQEEAGDIQGG